MNQHLLNIINILQQDKILSDEEKNTILKSLKDADKELEITTFKLDRTEKVKRTTAILLEETIEELEQKREAVEAQNRELEIESSLEKVRTVAMAMRKLDNMLDVCKTITQQLELLNVKDLRNVQTAIFDEVKHIYINYEYYHLHDKTFITEVDYTKHPVQLTFANQMLKGEGSFFSTTLTGVKLNEFVEHQRASPEFVDPFLSQAKSLSWYWYSLGPIAFGVSAYAPMNEADQEIVKRFKNVFELSYQRYVDVANAAAQAHEARVEASLERMRGVAMSMRKSDELINVCESMYKELTVLGFTNIRNAQIAIKNEEKQTYIVSEYSDFNKTVLQEGPWNSSPIVKDLYNEMESSKDAFYKKVFEGQEFEDWRNWRKSINASIDNRIDTATSMCFYLYSIGVGHVGISTFGTISNEQEEILKRFKNVFELSYQRYMDVANAEAQAREAQIALALERVRARTMAMQKSDELSETAYVLFQQFKELGEDPEQLGIGIFNEKENVLELWTTINGKIREKVVTVSLDEPVVMRKFYAGWKEEKKTLIIDISGKELEQYNDYRNSLSPVKMEPGRLKDRRVISIAYFSKGAVSLATSEPRPPETLQLLERFANVFDLTYTRFLDLKKAEAQSREAQIELALERVRARTMAMQKSEELPDTSLVLFQQLKELGEPAEQLSIGIINKAENIVEVTVTLHGKPLTHVFRHSIDEPRLMNKIYTSWKAQQKMLVVDMQGEELEAYNKYRNELIGTVTFTPNQHPGDRRVVHSAFFSKGMLALATNEPRPQESLQLLERFAKVFDGTYTRFLDLQKAEAQAREAQIELGLERVRARAMAMQTSEELNALSGTVFTELTKLDLVLTRCVIMIYDPATNDSRWWMANSEAPEQPMNFPVQNHEQPPYAAFIKAWKERKVKWIYTLEGKTKKVWDDFLFTETGLCQLPDFVIAGMKEPERVYLNSSFFNFGNISLPSLEPLSDEHFDIMLRFAKVFDLTYTRFNDLQKAEAQAREAQIEAGLERVRYSAMAMQSSEDVGSATAVVFNEISLLNVETMRCGITIIRPDMTADVWAATTTIDGKEMKGMGSINFNAHPLWVGLFDAWKNKEENFSYALEGDDLVSYYKALASSPDYNSSYIQGREFPGHVFYAIFFEQGAVFTFSLLPHDDEKSKVLKRFTAVFSLTFRRYLDLKQAEAQAREAQIEVSLERVRASAMAMHNSQDLSNTIKVFYQQIGLLSETPRRCGIDIIDKETHSVDISSMNTTEEGKPLEAISKMVLKGHRVLEGIYDSWLLQKEYFPVLKDDEIREYYDFVKHVGYPDYKDAIHYGHFFSFPEGCIYVWTTKALSEDELKIYRRFTSVLSLTYKRYKDLLHAEAQARDAQIEASLERVRSKAMAMQKSDDLANAVAIVFEELDKLNLGMLRCGIGILNKEKRCAQVWTTTVSENNTVVQVSGDESMDIHPLLTGAFEAWIKQEDHSYVLQGEDLNNYYKAVAGENFKLPDSQSLISGTEGIKQYYYNAVWSSGGLFAFRGTAFQEEAKIVLRRFADVFDFTYTRFNDLKQAEAQAKEAKIEVALERVRSRTLAMQKSDELAETAAVLFRQLINLGIAPNRLYIGIVKDEDAHIEFWVTDEDGSKVSTQFIGDASRNASMKKMYDAWKEQKKSLTIDMKGKELATYFHYLADELKVPFKQGLEQKRRIQTVAYFGKGFIGIASPDQQPEETTLLLERFAAVFNLTYTRFNDLKVAEAHAVQAEEDLIKLQTEKKRAEDALTELRATQTQLIQSEKMASLGELTAGIAHEIQNPLNFVNNFSEVTNELIEELKEERLKVEGIRNKQLEEELLNDIKQNLEKINHHGKRADAIVKGMLQHSRASSATKELTDINKLADEYLRLAYHGLRAKDKSFNATLKPDYDESIENISIVPQDIGRVVLNLITNAFYAVTEKKKQNGDNYEPTVSVSTSRPLSFGEGRGEVHISVKDNGNGIPPKILEKIFQPFFTTKPTGQGTGLGLSLAYDIVKAHGGELKVDTKEGEGSTFTIYLPGQYNP